MSVFAAVICVRILGRVVVSSPHHVSEHVLRGDLFGVKGFGA